MSSPPRRPTSSSRSRTAVPSDEIRVRARDRRADGRYGPYVTEVLRRGRREAENGVALRLDVLGVGTLDDALRPSRCRASWELDGEDVTAQNGRYGPYVKKGTESRSLETEEQLFTVTVDDAKALLAQPPRRRVGRGAWPAQGARRRSGHGAPDRRQGRPLRPLRHRR